MFGVLRPPSPPERPVPTPDSAPPPPRSLAPMPPSDFASREDLLAGTKDWTASQGYAIVIARSRANRLWLKCDRGGNYENRRNLTQDQRKRKRGESRLLGCPFKMLATIRKDGTWRVETDNPEHNHGPSEDLSMHPTLRRMNDAQLAKVHEMFEAGRSPAETVEELKATWPDIKVLTRDIYNARKKYKTQRDETMETGPREETRRPVPVPDPNGVFPGPDENGRWAWVPDGEEVTSRKSRRRRRVQQPSPPPIQHAPLADMTDDTLDPQLQSAMPSQPILELDTRHMNVPDPEPESESAPHYHTRQRPPSSAPAHQAGTYPTTAAVANHDSAHSPTPLTPSPSRLRSQQQQNHQAPSSSSSPSTTIAAAAAAATLNAANTTTDNNNNDDSPALLAARISRMEQEQRDQKSMLAQILGAVKGMNSPSPSSPG